MKNRIRIDDSLSRLGSNFLDVRLEDILSVITDIGEGYSWVMFEINASLNEWVEKPDYNDLDNWVNESSDGMELSWDELVKLAPIFHQIIDTIIVAYKDENHKPIIGKGTVALMETSEIVLELVDSTFWEIYTKDAKILDRFKKKFKDVSFI